jgi:acyl carrier protein
MELLDAILAAAANYLEVDPSTLGPDTTFAYLQVDSLDVVNILEDASSTTGQFIELDPEQEFTPTAETTLADFVAHLVARPG